MQKKLNCCTINKPEKLSQSNLENQASAATCVEMEAGVKCASLGKYYMGYMSNIQSLHNHQHPGKISDSSQTMKNSNIQDYY